MRAMGECGKLRIAERDYDVGSGGGTENLGRREVGDGVIGIRGRGRDVRGIESGRTSGMGENREEGCRGGWFGLMCWGGHW